ncbi:MAG: glycosyltransferase [Acidobacteria bacterium]|nr:glycosyltransferase [Acidobacteriota bacterium]
MLRRLLASLQGQETGGVFRLSVTVVDNDGTGSAAGTVAEFRRGSDIPVRYVIEPQQNISSARNKALTTAAADYYACIDDDEIAEANWLLNLYRTIVGGRAAGVLGPVRASYDDPPPAWLVRSRIQERKEFPTGTVMTDPKYCRTGNVMFSGALIASQDRLFDPAYGRTGGEDVDFFRRMMKAGHGFVWCNEAVVHEVTPLFRQRRSYYLRRALLRGVVQAGQAPLLSLDSLKSLGACAAYTLILPFAFVFNHRSYLSILIRDLDHAGKVLARCGIKPVRRREAA